MDLMAPKDAELTLARLPRPNQVTADHLKM